MNAYGQASAKVMGTGAADLKLKLNPMAKEPTFNLTADIKKVDLTKLNPVFDWQWGVDTKKGTFSKRGGLSLKSGVLSCRRPRGQKSSRSRTNGSVTSSNASGLPLIHTPKPSPAASTVAMRRT